MSRLRVWILGFAMLLAFAACESEVHWVPATQVILAVRSNLGDELTSVAAVVFDVRGEKRGDSHLFELGGTRTLPLSFSVVPTLRETTQFLVVLTGKDAQGAELVQTRAIVNFVSRKSVGVELWLYAGCKERNCQADETCTATRANGEVSCVAIPVLESKPIKPGQEFDAGLTGPVELNDAGLDAALDARSETDSAPPLRPMGDAAADALADGAAQEAEAAIPEPEPDGVCAASPERAVCVDEVMHHCNVQGRRESEERCASARRCLLGQEKATCAPCEPGTFRCTKAALERCAADGFTWTLSKTCSSEALCNVGAGDCTTSACTATTRKCMGDDLYGCSSDLTKLTLLKECDANLCDESGGECDVCVANAKRCNGDVVESCDDKGQQLSTVGCPSATPKCTGNGQCVQCLKPEQCPVPVNTCQSATCAGSPPRCGTANKVARTPCSAGVCNGSGSCVECVIDGDCTKVGRSKCLDSQCVGCKGSGDCAQGYECIATHVCQRVSLAGTGASCTSYGKATASQCGGYYCGVNEAQLSAALVSDAACNLSASFVCANTLWTATGKCAREIKTANAVAGNEELRPKVITCVQNALGASAASVSATCMNCYVDAENCANDKCLFECLAGDSADCDRCRAAKGCNHPLYPCTGLPNPL